MGAQTGQLTLAQAVAELHLIDRRPEPSSVFELMVLRQFVKNQS